MALKKKYQLVTMLFLLGMLLATPHTFSQPRWQQRVEYKIDVTLNEETNRITGHETLVYHNNSPDTLKKLYYHLYLNAFKPGSQMDRRNSFLNQGRVGRRISRLRPWQQGWTKIQKLTYVDEDSTEQELEFEIDDTILIVHLPRPLPPGQSIRVDMDFESQIPLLTRRMGRKNGRYSMAQWYPKVAAYDHLGWHYDQYIGREFYGDFGNFEVSITLPEDYVVGATGDLLNAEEIGVHGTEITEEDEIILNTIEISSDSSAKAHQDTVDQLAGFKTWKFRAENVHDFAWVADPNYIHEDTTWNDITIHLLHVPEVRSGWKDMKKWAAKSLEFFSKSVGPYPYRQFTIAQAGDGGMEYPNLIMIRGYGSRASLASVTVHEMGHNWFYGLLGNNETREAWLDEGFTVAYQVKGMEAIFGPTGYPVEEKNWYQKLFYPPPDKRQAVYRNYLWLAKLGYEEPILTHSDIFREGITYNQAVYEKGACVLFMLEYVLGEEVFEKVIKTYYERWHLRHPYSSDFQKVAEEVSGRELDWFFDQWLTTTKTCDYAINKIRGKWVTKNGKQLYRAEIELENKGEIIMPIDLELTLKNGKKQLVLIPVDRTVKQVPDALVLPKWDWVDRRYTAVVELPDEVKRAEIDPSLRLQDINRLNNRSGILPRIEIHPRIPGGWPSPLDAYLIEYRPSLWYNDADGVRLGLVLKGQYSETDHNTYLGAWIGTMSRQVDYDFRYRHPVNWLGRLSNLYLRSFKLEGRQGASVSLFHNIRPLYLQRPPYNEIEVSFNHSRIVNGNYLFDPNSWDNGNVNTLNLYYFHNSDRDNAFRCRIELETDFFGSDYKFNKATFEADKSLYLSPIKSLALFRLYGGYINGNPPIQRLYYLAGASPQEEFEDKFYRSRGTLPDVWRSKGHLQLGGGGNLRGYVGRGLQGNFITAVNVEWVFRNPFAYLLRKLPLISKLRPLLFYDGGSVWNRGEFQNFQDYRKAFKADAGLGLRYTVPLPRFMGRHVIRVDFPIWVSHPLPGKDKVSFRWVIGIGEAF